MWLSLGKNLLRSLAVLLVVTFATFSLMFGNGRASPEVGARAVARHRRPSRPRSSSWGWTAPAGPVRGLADRRRPGRPRQLASTPVSR